MKTTLKKIFTKLRNEFLGIGILSLFTAIVLLIIQGADPIHPLVLTLLGVAFVSLIVGPVLLAIASYSAIKAEKEKEK
jgi:hypothetical protein